MTLGPGRIISQNHPPLTAPPRAGPRQVQERVHGLTGQPESEPRLECPGTGGVVEYTGLVEAETLCGGASQLGLSFTPRMPGVPAAQ